MSINNFTVLVVDDDQDDLEIFCEAIHSINQSVSCLIANNGRAALNLLNQLLVLPQIIFMDYNMPQMDGGKCLENIKSNERLKDIPVVMYSTSFTDAVAKELRQVGAYLLKKETEFKEIVNNIAGAIRKFYPDF